MPTKEIAHGIVLPPGGGVSDRVLFIPQPAECLEVDAWVKAWVWKPRTPSNAELIELHFPVPPNPTDPTLSPEDGSEDPFCSGHTVLPDGSVLIAGGLDRPAKCLDTACNPLHSAVGHWAIRRLDTSTDPPTWLNTAPMLIMNRERWYPTAITLHNGDAFIAGHGSFAEPDGPGGCAPTYGPEAIHETWDRLTWNPAGLVNPALTISRQYDGDCVSDDYFSVSDYPRLHLLTTGNIVAGNIIFGETPHTRFLNVLAPKCTEGRWERSNTAIPAVDREGGNTVHLIYPDPAQAPAFVPVDVIYAIGGTDGDDDTDCSPGPGSAIYASVEKLDQPSLTSQWEGSLPGASPPDLHTARFNHNSVLLLDGSILVNGGSDGISCNEPSTTVALPSERYRPPEIFGITEGGATDIWKEIPYLDPSYRPYHSVAGLLPDGRVFSAGGRFANSYHSVTVYSPSYFFNARPVITSSPGTVAHNAVFDVQVTLSGTTSIVKHVGLVRSSSSTHAWDMNQRYVMLEVVLTSGTAPNLTLTLRAPLNGFVAPPGFYLLSVVQQTTMSGEGKWVPSPGKWIRVDLP